MVFSANPLDCEYVALEGEWTNPRVFANVSNSVQANCGPLSENKCSGISSLSSIPLNFMM